MEDTATIEQPQVEIPPQGPGDDKLRVLHDAVSKDYDIGSFDDFKKNLQDPAKRQSFYNTVGKDYNLGTYDEFQNKIGISSEHQTPPASIQDIRHLQDMANKPVESTTTTLDPTMGGSVTTPDPASVAANKAYKDQFDKAVGETGQLWGAKPETVKQVLNDFPDEPDENKLKQFAQTAETNPVQYGRLRDANSIRMAIAQDGPGGVHDANIFNHLQQADNYTDLTENVIPMQRELMDQHGLGQQYMDALKREKSPLINSLDPGLLSKYWTGDDKELGLTPDQYAGLETERLFSPQKAQMDLEMIKHSRNLDESGQANPIDVSKEPYEYRRGLESVLMNLDMQGRNNKARYISEQKPQVDVQMADLVKSYNDKLANATPLEATQLHQQFNNEPLVQEANKLEQGQDEIAYSAAEDARRYPLTNADQATRIVKDAMQGGAVGMADVRGILQGAGESADNTMRWIKNTAINLVGSEGAKSFNNTSNIGHQELTELSGYEGSGYTGVEQTLNVPREITDGVQAIFKDPNLSDSEKQQRAISYVRDNFDKLTVNPKAGQQNMTGKAVIYQASNTIGQILGIADQSFLMGGAIGDASKLQQMTSAFTPMYMTTQNQMYEQALKNGDEHPLLKSNTDATIISLASLINPDIKVVRGMVGAESAVGKTLAGISDETWGKVLSENAPLVDRAVAAAKATGKQLGLANLQYGLIAPVATGLAHKALFNEDPNLLDRVKDGVIQTSISMALPALLHGVWGGMRATEVNPTQKYALVEAGLHPDENIDLIDSRIKAGQISEVAGHDMKMLVKHAGEFMLNTEMTKTDGTPMDEKEVADNLYTNLRLKVLEGKLKTAAEPMKPVIEERIHELNKDITDLHTSEDDKQKFELNQLLHDNLDRIRDKMPTMEQPIKDAIAENRPEDVFKEIASQALETTKKDGEEISSRPLTEEIFGKPLVEKAIELSKQKSKNNGKETNDNAQTEGQVEKPGGTGIIKDAGAVLPIQPITINTPDNATTTSESGSGQSETSQNTGSQEIQEPVNSEQDGGQPNNVGNVPPDGQAGAAVEPQPGGSGSTGGIAGRVKNQREVTAGVKSPESGTIPTTQELVDIGRKLLKEGRDPEKDVRDFEADPDKNISANAMGTVRARLEELQKITNKSIDDHGEDSPEADAAKKAEEQWAERIQPMQTEWSRIGKVQMGDTDLDTGTVTSLKRAFKEVSGKPLTEKQSETAKEFRSKLKQHEDRIADLENQLDNVRKQEPTKSTTFTDKTKKAADVFRKLKTKEFTFKDSNGNDIPIQKMGVSWNDLVELGAKAIEKTGEIADGISAILDKVKDADWYKRLSKEDQDRFGRELEDYYTGIADKKEASRIKALEKQLADLEAGKVKEKGAARTPSAREQELKDQIFEAKKNLGLIKSKATPTPKTPIEKPTIDISSHFIGKKDNTFTTQESSAIWEHTKQVIKDGKEDFHAVVEQVAMDTGLSRDQVNHAIEQPKGAKAITNKIYAETYRQNQVKQAAKIWVKTANQSNTKKFWNAVIKVPSAIVTALHGTVAPATHVGGDLYRPTNWKSYFTFMGNSYKFAFGGMTDAGKATYEKAMNGLVKDSMYPVAKRAGVKCDPTDLKGDDYSKYQGVFGRLSKMGERGFNAMKPYRLEQFKKLYNNLPDQVKGNDDVLKTIANIVNLSSGTTDVKTGKYTDVAIFAPKLVLSQYQRIFSEPWKAVGTFTKWGASLAAPGKVEEPTYAQKLQATMVARHVGQMMTTYLGGLAANQAILMMTGSKQRINFLQPLDPDWMRFKVSGKDVDVSGGMNSSLRFVASLTEEGLRANGILKTDERGKPADSEGRKVLQQAANKLSPLASDLRETLFTTTDNAGNPLPWSSVNPSASQHKLTWPEYFESKSPIFISEGFKAFNDAVRANPEAKASMNSYLEGVVIGILSGTTGAKISPEPEPKTPKGGRPGRGSSRNK